MLARLLAVFPQPDASLTGGTVELKIPPASRAGSKLRLRGRGIPATPPGDFYVVLQIALPAANDDKARAAYAAMAAALPFNPRARDRKSTRLNSSH